MNSRRKVAKIVSMVLIFALFLALAGALGMLPYIPYLLFPLSFVFLYALFTSYSRNDRSYYDEDDVYFTVV